MLFRSLMLIDSRELSAHMLLLSRLLNVALLVFNFVLRESKLLFLDLLVMLLSLLKLLGLLLSHKHQKVVVLLLDSLEIRAGHLGLLRNHFLNDNWFHFWHLQNDFFLLSSFLEYRSLLFFVPQLGLSVPLTVLVKRL